MSALSPRRHSRKHSPVVPDPAQNIRLCRKGDHELSRTQAERPHNPRMCCIFARSWNRTTTRQFSSRDSGLSNACGGGDPVRPRLNALFDISGNSPLASMANFPCCVYSALFQCPWREPKSALYLILKRSRPTDIGGRYKP